MSFIERTNRVLAVAEKIFNGIAAIMLLLIMLIVPIDVLLRYAFNSPLAWSYELISLYLMVGLFFFALSGTLSHNAHIGVDILHNYMSPYWRHVSELIGYGLACLVFAGIVYVATISTFNSYVADEVIAGGISWPTWLSTIAVPMGAGLMLLRMLFRFVGHALSVFTHRSVIELPPVSGSGAAD